MSFISRINKLIGSYSLEYGLIDEEAVMLTKERKDRKQDIIIDLAKQGDVIAIFMSSLLIDFFKEAPPICKEENYNVYVFEESKEKTINAYGETQGKALLKKGKIGIIGNEIIKDPGLFEGDYKCTFGKDKFLETLFGTGELFQISMASIIEAEIEGKRFCWKKRMEKLSSNPIMALAQAINKYGELCFIEKNGLIYQNPEILINEKMLSDKSSESIKNEFLYNTIIELKDSFAYYISMGGKPLALYRKAAISKSYFNKDVIIDNELIHPEWKKGIDYVVTNEIATTKLSNWLLSFNKEKCFLSYPDKNKKLKGMEHLREVKLEKRHFTDIEVNYLKNVDELIISYKVGILKHDLFPLFYKERYSFSDLDDNLIYMVEL